MRFLWGDELRLNVVHVDDVAAAMWIAAVEAKPGSIYNLADQQDLTQGTLNKWIASIFKIEVSCMGSIVSALAKLNLSGVAEEANDKHVPGFTELCHVSFEQQQHLTPATQHETSREHANIARMCGICFIGGFSCLCLVVFSRGFFFPLS